MKLSSKKLGPVVVVLILLFGADIRLCAQTQRQTQPTGPVRSHAEETLASWNHIGNKIIAMAKDFPEDKYDFKVQKGPAHVRGKSFAHSRGELRLRQPCCRFTDRPRLRQR